MAELKKPNTIVFFTDQQRWDTSSLHGNPLDLMPNFERMALSGTHVSHSFTCQPVCGPARSALQSGLYPTTTGCFTNARPLPEGCRTLAHEFGDAGYQTAYIGKWHLAPREIEGAVSKEMRFGYDYWLVSNVLEFTSGPYDTVLYDNDDNAVKLPGYRVDAMTDAAIRYIDSHHGEKPFFLFLSYIEPHHQNNVDDYPPPDGYRERYAARWIPPDLAALGGSSHQHLGGYCGMVKRLDEGLGRIMDTLKSLGLSDNTNILFTSDHGCHFKTRNSEYKRSCHESAIRVPTAACGPSFDGGGRLPELVSLIDLPPTLLDAAGIAVPDQMQGRSIMPLVRNQETFWPEEVFVQISESQVGRAVRTHRWKYGVTAPDKDSVKDAGSDSYEEQYLYDLEADPYELTNLIETAGFDEVCEVMKGRLLRRMIEAGEKAPVIVSARRGKRGQWQIPSEDAHL